MHFFADLSDLLTISMRLKLKKRCRAIKNTAQRNIVNEYIPATRTWVASHEFELMLSR